MKMKSLISPHINIYPMREQGLFSHEKRGEKWAQCVGYYCKAREDCGVGEDYFVCAPCTEKV